LPKNKTNQVRINAGVWRSRLLKFPDVEGLRPTPDRVRQTVFNWLGQDLTGKTCLDLFAGTGAMGFEALSRNAKTVTMVEQSTLAFKALKQNQTMLSASEMQIFQQDALAFLSQNKQLFDIIFCDPPYNKNWLAQLLPQLKQHLAPNGIVYAESEYALQDDDVWQVQKSGKAGNVVYHLLIANTNNDLGVKNA
jgi:16S rRNA (guanine966-N2)-methyltransferase